MIGTIVYVFICVVGSQTSESFETLTSEDELGLCLDMDFEGGRHDLFEGRRPRRYPHLLGETEKNHKQS